MTRFFLGGDVGATKTHVLVADETGRALGFGQAGPGNHEGVGYEGLAAALRTATDQALAAAGLSRHLIAGAGFGIGGLDWPSEREPHLQAIASLGLRGPVEAVNDATLGLLAGCAEGWGVAVVSGTGCNCRGWDATRRHEGMVTGHGVWMGEGAGAGELVVMALRALSYEWTRRGPATQLTPAFLRHTGARSLGEMLEKLLTGKLELDAEAAPLIFQVAAAGDPVARQLVCWAGAELGELANAVIRQLGFKALAFDLVLVGGMFDAGCPLIEPMRGTVHALAPGARFVRLEAPPVVGAVLLGMEQAGMAALERRESLIRSARALIS